MESNKSERDGFTQLLQTEWANFWAVRGRVIGMAVSALVIVLLGLLYAKVFQISCEGPSGNVCPAVPVGPGGEAVMDKFYFVHQPLIGDGSITVRVTSLTGIITYPPPNHNEIVPGVVPWAKAGIIIKQSTIQGTAYTAMMVTGSHGVRMQYNFTQDIAGTLSGVSADSPRWLRLTRSGDTLTGYESTDGTQWAIVSTVHLIGLPATIQIGLFVTSPCDLTVSQMTCRFANATAVFDHISLEGATGGEWSNDDIGAQSGLSNPLLYGKVEESGGTFTMTGSGDIAPQGTVGSTTIENILIGTFAGGIGVIIVAVLFITAEYRRGQIGTTLLNSKHPRRMLAAKAIVIGLVTFITGLVAAIVVVQVGKQINNQILPVTPLIEIRIEVGNAALLAVVSVFAIALGALFRRSFPAILTAITLVILPYILAIISVLPVEVSQWLFRLTPAAAFAIQQSLPEYPQVINLYAPQTGYYPLAPWAGFAVLCGYTILAFGLAIIRLRRMDP